MRQCQRTTMVTLLVVISACTTDVQPKPIKAPVPRVTHLRVKPDRGPIQRVPLEDYVRATILSEFDPPEGDPADVKRMLEVQAVIARTYAVANRGRHASQGFDLCATTHCQLYQPGRLKGSMWTALVDDAARETAGTILWHGGAPVSALFHADCGGHTSAADQIWQGPGRAYLSARKDDGPAESAHIDWRFEVASAALRKALNADARTRVGKWLADVRVTVRDNAGRAVRIALDGSRAVVVRGEELRGVMTRAFGDKSVRSTKFQIQRRGNSFVFVGRGYGHGVGLCQTGAYARLRAGAHPQQVLARYYPGTRLLVMR